MDIVEAYDELVTLVEAMMDQNAQKTIEARRVNAKEFAARGKYCDKLMKLHASLTKLGSQVISINEQWQKLEG